MESERAQIEQLWDSTASRVQRFLTRLVGNIDTANDLLSQTFLEAARHWRRYRGEGSRQAWLFGIARNLARRELRRLRLDRSEPLAEEALSARPTEPGVTDPAYGRVYIYYGARFMDDLPDMIIEGSRPFTSFGSRFSSLGDINDDGFDDIVVSAHSSFRGDTCKARVFLGDGIWV